MSERLCPDCQQQGNCLFREYTDIVVLELITKGVTGLDESRMAALEVHQKIAEERKRARERMCPHLNNIDPDYPGKELL